MGIERPKYPPECLEEIFRSRRYRQDFRIFLDKHEVVAPLLFLEAANRMKKFRFGSEKELAHVKRIHRKFFRKESNFGRKFLCDDKTIHLISEADSISPNFFWAAYIPVKKTMEKIWFKKYLRTFQPKVPAICERKHPPIEMKIQKSIQQPRLKWRENITQSQRTMKKLFHFISLMQSTLIHRQMIDYVRILYEEDIEQVKDVLEPRYKGSKKVIDKFEETISGLKRGDLPNLDRRILFLRDMILGRNDLHKKVWFLWQLMKYKTAYHCLHQYGEFYKEKTTLVKKARLIMNKYLNIGTEAHLLLGVPQRLTNEAKMSFMREGVSAMLFHELTLVLLPVGFKIWKTMQIELNKCEGGKEGFANLLKLKQNHFAQEETVNMFKNLKKEKIIRSTKQNSQFITLNFSVQEGMRIYLPKQLTAKEKRAAYRYSLHRDLEKELDSITDLHM